MKDSPTTTTVFRSPDPELSAPRSAELAAYRAAEQARQREVEARFHRDLRKPRERGPLHRAILILVASGAGVIVGGCAGYVAWGASWFGESHGDVAGGLAGAFDVMVGGIVGLVVFTVLGVRFTRKKSSRVTGRHLVRNVRSRGR